MYYLTLQSKQRNEMDPIAIGMPNKRQHISRWFLHIRNSKSKSETLFDNSRSCSKCRKMVQCTNGLCWGYNQRCHGKSKFCPHRYVKSIFLLILTHYLGDRSFLNCRKTKKLLNLTIAKGLQFLQKTNEKIASKMGQIKKIKALSHIRLKGNSLQNSI